MSPRRVARSSRGFTLVELTVALVAGLIVALGIMTLSKEASRTFNEEMRSSAAEAALRSAADRLRADLQRAGYMSTANIMGDPMIAKSPAAPSNVSSIVGAGMLGLKRLAAVSFVNGQLGYSETANSLSLSLAQPTALAPDMFEIGGNLTTAEQFQIQMLMPSNGACTKVVLSPNSAAMFRIAAMGLTTPSANSELRNAFQPVPATMSTQFLVRIVDTSGHTQYVATCPMAAAAGLDPTGTPFVWIDTTSTPIQSQAQTGTQGGTAGYCVGCQLNPVQIVRWEITSATLEQTNQPQYATGLDQPPLSYGTGQVDTTKYDLMRTYVDATGTPVPQTSEIVAEYAVDLKLAFSVEKTTAGSQNPSIQTLAFDDASNLTWAPDVSKVTPPTPNVGPQRIRSVRARIVTRTAQADRTVNVPVANYGTQQFIYRYCINPTPACTTNDGTLRWARARTLTTEVALPNTQGFY
jgi:prepilin-type N-terminal cleavage/methylation domain-containing protein